jgi:hypothetical protein
MGTFLSADELAELVGCKVGQKACYCRWLDRNGWPYVRNRAGFPMVARAYYDARMSGMSPAPAAKAPPGPDREALLKRVNKNDRSKKVA